MSDSHEHSGTVVVVTGNGMGQADQDLRQKLIQIYLKMLLENSLLPEAICFYGEGVKLVVNGSPVLGALQELESKGVLLISCLTCINHYNLAEQVGVGVIGGMHDIIAAQWRATKVITL